MMEICFGGTNYNKLLMVHANISCSAKVINRPKSKLRHSCNALYELLMELNKKGGALYPVLPENEFSKSLENDSLMHLALQAKCIKIISALAKLS